MNEGGHVNKGRRCIRTYHSRIFRSLKALVYNYCMANSKITEKFARMKEGKVNCEFWLSAEAVKALVRMVEITGTTQSSIIEMSLVAMLVGMTSNPYYDQLINQEETMRLIKDHYPKQISKFSFDELRSRALRGRSYMQKKWLQGYVESEELYQNKGLADDEE